MRRCVKITIIGKVQDVGYRSFAKKNAEKFQIEGIAQNQEDGSVLITVCGDSNKLDDFIDALYKGPPKAKVNDVLVEPFLQDRDFRGVFRVIGINK
ncbi:acylphosphatase [Candidatus Dependentiae bacterium]|nr:acylphosphatase [Candidatus Dependentiae bacterium]